MSFDSNHLKKYFQHALITHMKDELIHLKAKQFVDEHITFIDSGNTPNSIYLNEMSQMTPNALRDSFILHDLIERMDFIGDRIFYKTELACRLKAIISPELSNE